MIGRIEWGAGVAMVAGAVLALSAGAALAEVDPGPYGGGACREMSQNHDPKALWVGHFVGVYSHQGGGGGAFNDIACFDDHKKCMAWVNRDSGQAVDRIIMMKCHQGL